MILTDTLVIILIMNGAFRRCAILFVAILHNSAMERIDDVPENLRFHANRTRDSEVCLNTIQESRHAVLTNYARIQHTQVHLLVR